MSFQAKAQGKTQKATPPNESHPHMRIPAAIRSGKYNKFHNVPFLVKRTCLPPRVFWNGDLSKFTDYKLAIQGHCRQSGASYIIKADFIELYLEQGDLAIECPPYKGRITLEQLEQDTMWFYGMLESSLRGAQGKSALIKHTLTEDGIKT